MQRELTDVERAGLRRGRGVSDLAITCEADQGYGPCGTYLDWTDCQCVKGHEIYIDTELRRSKPHDY